MKIKNPIKISFYSAIAIASILILAALAKWLYPQPQYFFLGKIAIFADGVIAVAVLLFYRKVITWQILSWVFSVWLGYSFFWLVQNQSCGCFGSMGTSSSALAMGLDLFMIALSWINMALLGARKRLLIITMVFALLFALVGIWLGTDIFHLRMMPPPMPAPAIPVQ